MAVVIGTDGSGAGFDFTWEGVSLGSSLICGLGGTGTGSASAFRIDNPSPPDVPFTAVDPARNENSLFSQAWYLHDSPQSGDLPINGSDTGLSANRVAAIEVTGLADAAPAAVNGASNASGTAHSCGEVSISGAGLIVGFARASGSTGTVTGTNGFTAFQVNDEVACYRVVTTGGNYTPTFTTENSVSSEAQATAWDDAGGGGGVTVRTLQLLGIG